MKTTIRKNKVTISVLGGITILFMLALLLLPATQAVAKTEKVKGRNVSQITQMHVFKVDDVDGHVIAIYERRGLGFFDGEVATYLNRAMLDSTKGKGNVEGYVIYTFEDGSTTVSKFQGTMEPREGKKFNGKGTYTYIRGSGRFEGIGGSGSWTAKSYTPYSAEETKSDLVVDFTGTQTLPK